MPPPPTFDVRLARARMISPNVRHLTFERVSGEPFVFQAGQWVSLVLPLAEGEARRAYSVASAPNGTASFEIAVTKVDGGPGSTYLHALEEGGTLRVIGPQGFFTRVAGQPTLFVGTGTGVTPLRSMILDALGSPEKRDANRAAPMTLIFGVRHDEDRLFADELDALAAQHPTQLRVLYTLSRPGPTWTGLTGYVQTHIEAEWRALEAKAPGTPPHLYVCGLERMVGAARDLLRKTMGVDRKQVHSERYD